MFSSRPSTYPVESEGGYQRPNDAPPVGFEQPVATGPGVRDNFEGDYLGHQIGCHDSPQSAYLSVCSFAFASAGAITFASGSASNFSWSS